MKIRGLTLLLVATTAAAGVGGVLGASGAAAAEPAFYECVKEAGGKFRKGCKEEGGTGGFALREGVGKKPAFKGTGGALTFHVPGILEFTCASWKQAGERTAPTTLGHVVWTLSKCTTLGKSCTSAGQESGTIVTKDLAGSLGYLNKAKAEVGLDLRAETGTVLAEFTCEGLTLVWTGSIIGEVTPVNVFDSSSVTSYEVTEGGDPRYRAFEGGAEDVLLTEINGGAPEVSGMETSVNNSFGEALEIKA
jgi:hypothetical protein